MRYTFLLLLSTLLPLTSAAQAPTVSNVTFDGIGHSVVRVRFSASAQFYYLRTRYVASPGTCTAGSGGQVQGSGYSLLNHDALHAGDGNTIVVGGLTQNTTYQICPEISTDFSSWSTGAGATVTTLARPAQHPALPIAPSTFNTDYPSTSGYDVVSIGTNCFGFTDALDNAVANQTTKGTIINIAPGAVCTGPFNLYRKPPDLVHFAPGNINSVNNTISVASHGFAEGAGIIFGTSYGCLPGSLTDLNGGNCMQHGPLIAGQLYYVHVIDSNRFQVFSGGPANSPGSTLCQLPDGGSGYDRYFVKWPRPLSWIVIRTSTPDLQFTPEHVRTSPEWLPKMAIFKAPPSSMGGAVTGNTLVSVGNYDNNDMSMLANIRFVGLQFTYSDNPSAHSSSDPLPWYSLFATTSTSQNIIVDRCYFHGLGTPHRVYNAIRWDGMNSAIIDSYLDNFEYFHAASSGLSLTKVN